MVIARDPRQAWKYVLVQDRGLPRDQQTVFLLRHLPLVDEQAAFDGIERTRDGSVVVDTGSRALRVLRAGLVGWENLSDGKGGMIEPVKNAQGTVADESMMRLEVEWRMELAGAIENEVVFDADTVGKSVPPST